MKKIAVALFILLLTAGLFAHPASNVTLKYDAKTMLLTVNYNHSVKSVAEHYIDSVVITVDGKEMIRQNLSTQEKKEGGTMVYKLTGIKSGSTVEAITNCNKTGKKTGKLNFK